MFINGKEQKVGLPQPPCQPDLFTPMEYLSVPSILGSIPIVELHIDFHFQKDKMTILKVCVWLGFMHHCFHVTAFQGHLLSLLDPCKLTPHLTLNSASES